MLSIPGIYDGHSIYPTEAIKGDKQYKVIITLVEEINLSEHEVQTLRKFGVADAAFNFWNDPREDIYNDLAVKE